MAIEIRETETFMRWMRRLKDRQARTRIAARLQRLAFGHFGDSRAIGNGISELRFHFGPGYRVYFVQRGDTIVILLCGGDKGSQARDMEKAKMLAKEIPEDEG
jgi:putative addiction module killer protein